MLTKEAVLQAVARGWCHENNANKEMDHDLAIAIAEEVIALRGMGGEAVGECVKATGSLKDMMIIRWRNGFTPHEGQLLYTAPAAPANEALAGRLPAIRLTRAPFSGRCVVSVEHNGKFVDVITDSGEAISHIVEPAGIAAALGGVK